MAVDNNESDCPKFAWIIMTALGCLDLVRGFMHTVLLEYAAENIMGLDLAVARDDQLLLLGVFGISNYITGMMLILIGLKARNLVQYVFLVIPLSYFSGAYLIGRVASSTARLGGLPMITGYIIVCIGTFVAILVWKYLKQNRTQ
ncbi:MAG: hypothetical protein ACXABN_16090 [Candidatus Thorarchaeota archaeon]|jgi:hypothetical protein